MMICRMISKVNGSKVNEVPNLQFDLKIKPDDTVGEPELHGFCNTGELAYEAVLFLRWKCEDNNCCCIPIMVKAFVAPLRKSPFQD